jgi:8-amino-7-oxononanoate synthase
MHEQGMGAAASRLIAGNNAEHEALDRAVAEWFGAERALTFSSGYAANVGTIPALVSRDDVIFSDALNHASVIDGCRLSRARVVIYPHGDTDALAALFAAHRSGARRAMIVTDGVFSMDGDLAPLSAIVELAREWNAWTYVDDAHSAGVIGDKGLGTASAAGVHGEIDVTVGTLGKSFGAAGAFVYGSPALAQYLVNRARSFIFSTAMMPAQAAAAREGLSIARAEPERRDRVLSNARHLRAALRAAGVEPLGDDSSHIVPVHVGSAERTARVGAALAARGVLVGAVRPPTVPPGTSRIRIALSAAHTRAHIATLINALVDALRDVLPPEPAQ